MNTGSAALSRYSGFFSNFAQGIIPQDRLVRKEVALGVIREIVPPQTHIGLSLAPWMEVESDDVTFQYLNGYADGMAPARAEDAESELAMKDETWGGEGRASLMDWAQKDHYRPSDVSRFRDALEIAQQLASSGQLPTTVTNILDGFQARVARDDARRRRRLDNRIEWLIMTALATGGIAYNDGKIKFNVDFGRPANQVLTGANAKDYSGTTHDPIGDIMRIQQYMFDTYGVRLRRIISSRRLLNSFMNSDKFIARATGVVVGGEPNVPVDINYLTDGWGPDSAVQIVERACQVQFIEYDSVFRTRPLGSTVTTSTRFFPENRMLLLPDEADITEFDDTALGFGKTLTSPHPEGNWSAGFYEWERSTVDPWGQDRGTGVKAFPIFPHMNLTFAVDVTLPAPITMP